MGVGGIGSLDEEQRRVGLMIYFSPQSSLLFPADTPPKAIISFVATC